jgi:excisionase family DNA binding protein
VEIHRKPEPVVYNVPEIAALLDVNVVTAYELAKRKDFPALRVGEKRIMIPVELLEKWIQSQAEAPLD